MNLLYFEYENTNENELDSLIVKLRVTLETLKELKGVDKDWKSIE